MVRLSSFLGELISAEQGAFAKGRLITKNVALAQELVQEIDRKSYWQNIIFKLDMEKAFNRVEWRFLWKVLQKFSFLLSIYLSPGMLY